MSVDLASVSSRLLLSDEQAALRDTVEQVLQRVAPIARFRAMRDAGRTSDPTLWSALAELGWPAIPFAETEGGMGWGMVEVAIVMEALGGALAATPMLSTVMAGAIDTQSGIQSGRIVALAWQEDPRRPDPQQITTRVVGGRLSGTKRAVLDANTAEAFVVSARGETPEDGALQLHRVQASDARVTPLRRLDCRDAGDVTFDGAPATPIDGGLPALQAAIDAGTIALSAEMLGGASAALTKTLAWLKEREQFDVPLGSFQVLQHRAVDMYIGVDLARSAVLAAAIAHASGAPTAALASLAKARISDTYLHVCREAIQMHGGIGMTDEADIGLYLKRAAVSAETLGNAPWHRGRWAALHGY